MWIVALIIWVMLSGGSAAAFECVGVRLPSTIVICSDAELMRLADERQEAINEARGRIGEEAWPLLWEDQKDWVRSYATACGVLPDRPPPIPVPPAIKACFKSAAQARIAYIRAYGLAAAGTPAMVPRAGSPKRVGPGFDCTKATTPLAFLICGDVELSRLDLRFGQAYWALFQQIGPAAQPQLKEEDIGFIEQVQERCGLPKSGAFTAELSGSRDCVKEAYGSKRAEWISHLVGEAREEALRSPEEHLALQQTLQRLGFLPPGPADGVYARSTRAAIVAWQTTHGRTVTGLLGDIDARALAREISAGSQVIAQSPQTGVSGGGGAPEPRAPQARLASREEPKPSVPGPKAEIAGTGTAFAISKTSDFLTNYHVVKGCASVRLRKAELRRDGLVIANDERNDLAVVRAQISSVPLLHFRDGKPIRPADPVVVLGFPYAGLLATAPQVTTGAVSALAGVRDDTRYLQLTAPVQPGNSGGPLLDLSGNVVGIVSARINALAVAEATGTLPENINFAIKSGIVRGFLEANGIDYETAQSAGKLDPADVGEGAAKSVVMLECLR
jgi:S1-C subfamily serine protease/uncharacterized protein